MNASHRTPKSCRAAPWPLRAVALLLAALETVMPASPAVWAATESFIAGASPGLQSAAQRQVDNAPRQVSVNRTVPAVTPPSTKIAFSENPSDIEISRARIFSEPLAPVGSTTLIENRDLSNALETFVQRSDPEDLTALERFLENHPASPWRASLLVHMGVIYRHSGWFSKALTCWQESWGLAKREARPEAKAVADLAVAELLELNARLGRYDQLVKLLKEIEGREMNPALSEKLRGVHAGLWLMQNRPERAFRCGPMALSRIWAPHLSSEAFEKYILQSRSTPQGISLVALSDLANQLGMNFQMARRDPGSELVIPAVIHWKVGHYASILKRDGTKYFVDDPTFGEAIWVSQAALDAEASGYFLVSAGPLPAGWAAVSAEEGATIWGKGTTQTSDPSRTRPYDRKDCSGGQNTPMAQYAIHLMLVSLNIVDTPVGYAPPRGPAVLFRVTYNQREAGPPDGQPLTFTYSNLGQKWTFDWLSYVTDDPQNPNNAAYCYLPGGGYETYTGFSGANNSYAPQVDSHAVLVRTSSSTYERDLPDGSRQIFSIPDGSTTYPRKVFLTQMIDPTGNPLVFTYDSNFRLVAAGDALGQVTTLSYGLTNDTLKITQVTDPFGRYATLQYDGAGRLTNITDILGITSAFTYGTNTFITSLTTPYGTTTFTNGVDTQDARDSWLQATDPLGQTERVEYVDDGSKIPRFDVPDSEPSAPAGLGLYNGHLTYRTTYYWDKQAMQLYPGDYVKARKHHWLHSADLNSCTGVEESTKEPLEARTWFTYPGQSSGTYVVGSDNLPSTISRVLDDGSSQIYRYQRNSLGKVTQATDPAGRVTLFTYSTNLVDLLQVAQQVGTNNQVLALFSYNTNHLPLVAVDAAGQTNYFAYNGFGQLTALTNGLGQVTALAYDTNGYLTNITGALPGATTSFTYDGYGRVRTVTDSAGYTITTDYDAANRPAKITYPDNTYSQVVYDRLDPILAKDRRGHWSTTLFDALRRVSDTVDALGRHTHFDWCGCGSLAGITDPMGRVTTWVRDLQGRVTTKIYPDNTQVSSLYETNTSRLKSVTDAKGQTTRYQYNIDDNLKQVAYSNTIVATPSVSFTYDTNYNRLLTMTDGTGTTAYSYYAVTNAQLGAGKLQGIDGPLTNDTISYFYDALGRTTNRAINGIAQTATFDALGRVTTETNSLGSFSHAYVGTTGRIATNSYPNGQQTVFSYYGNTNDNRLQQIQNLLPNGQNLSAFSYVYDPDGQITTWTRQADANAPTVLSLGYDSADQLLSAILTTNTANGAVLSQYLYGYDPAGNRLSEEIQSGTNNPPAVTGAGYNNLNQLTNLSGTSGPMLFSGSLDKPGTVSVNGVPAAVNAHTTNFTGYASVSPGTNVVQLVAADAYGNRRTNNYQIVVTNNGVARAIIYDLNGNEVSAVTSSLTNTYEWDGADRLTAINAGTNRSEFTYDGLGRRMQIVEKQNGTVVSAKKFVWVGMQVCEERDSTGATVTKRFFAQGQVNGTTNLYYARDHLGNVREIADSSGSVRARYDYDPHGRRTKVSGDLDADFAFTGHYYHETSGLHLTMYRAYDANTGRWLSRDPIAEKGGLNLYDYVANDPVNNLDPHGLALRDWVMGAAVGAVAAAAVGLVGAAIVATAPELAVGLAVVGVVAAVIGTTAAIQDAVTKYQHGDMAGGDEASGNLAGAGILALVGWPLSKGVLPPERPGLIRCPTSFQAVVDNPLSLYGMSPEEVASLLGEGWTKGSYGNGA